LAQLKDDLFDEPDAGALVARLAPGKRARLEAGVPHGGRAGPDYGYTDGVRRTKHGDGRGRQMGLLSWALDEPKAAQVRWLYQVVADSDPRDLSYRGLAGALLARGAPTATGTGGWSGTQVRRILRNPKYAGLGVNLRTQRRRETFQEGGQVFEDYLIDARPASDYIPVNTDACPPIVSVAQWRAVQAKLDAIDGRRLAQPRRTDALTQSTLLDGGHIVCAHCGNRMTRYWHAKHGYPYYACSSSANSVGGCPRQTIRAGVVEDLALRLLAYGLTDPAHLLALAEAAGAHEAEAALDATLAEARHAASRERMAALDATRAKLTTALTALAAVDGMDGMDMSAQVATIRAQLDGLEEERADIAALVAQTDARRDRSAQRATFLRDLLAVRGGVFHFATGKLTETGAPLAAAIFRSLPDKGWAFTKPLGLLALGWLIWLPLCLFHALPTGLLSGPLFLDRDDGGVEVEGEARTEQVLVLALRGPSREALRGFLRRAGVVVRVSRPLPRAARPGRWTQPEERVTLQLAGEVEVRARTPETAETRTTAEGANETKPSAFGQLFCYGS
jgi:hypothetical protein